MQGPVRPPLRSGPVQSQCHGDYTPRPAVRRCPGAKLSWDAAGAARQSRYLHDIWPLSFSSPVSAFTAARNKQPTCRSIRETRELLCHGHSTVAGHVQSALTTIHEADAGLGAFVAVAGEAALREAEAADCRIGRLGETAWQDRPLLGVTLSVKDLMQTQELPTRRGSLLANRRAMTDAPAVARLRAAGAIVVGKTSTSEYGWSASTVSRVAGPTRNPWARELSAGGSSGGAAAAVSAGLWAAALGTDGA